MTTPRPPTDLDRLLVSTKFAPPRIGSRYIARPQLLKRLWDERQAKLTLVSGSPGFGKTILLAQWRQELMKGGYKVCWLSLSQDERDLSGFATHLFAALARLEIVPDDEMLLMGDGIGAARIDGAIAAIVNALAAADGDVHLLIDDYHHVEDPWAHLLLQKLLDHNPGNLHITLASRSIPPLSLSRLRVMGQVAEVECADLPFNLAETRLFIDQNAGSSRLTADELLQVHDLTNGWPASLQLISIMLRNRPEERSRLQGLGLRSADLHTYLSEEVVDALPPELSQFLEAISICRRFTVSLARAVSGREDAAELIARIEQENLLVVRVESDDRSPWYRFHPLFSEFLGSRLAQRDIAQIDELHRRASRWFDERQLLVEAIRHATLGRDPEAAVAIVERSVPDLWRLSHLGPLLHLVNSLPLAAIASRPRLAYLGSLTLALTGAPMRASAWIAQFRGDASQPNARFQRALVEATVAFQRDDTDQSLQLTDKLDLPPDTSGFERSAFLAFRVTALAAAGRYDEAYRAFDRYPIRPEDLTDGMALLAMGCRVIAMQLEGRGVESLPIAQDIYEKQAARQGRNSTGANLGAVGVVDSLYELDRIDDAREMLANRQHSLKRSSPQIIILSSLAEAHLERLQASPEAALALLDERIAWVRSLELDRVVAYLLLAKIQLLVGLKDLATARAVAEQLEELRQRHLGSRGFWAEIPMIAGLGQARLALARRDCGRAIELLEASREIARRLSRGRYLVVHDLLRAQIEDARLQPSAALQHLRRALEAGARSGLIRTFVDEGDIVRRLLARLREEGDLPEQLRDHAALVLRHFGGRDQPLGAGQKTDREKTLLTPREAQILQLVAAGMSNKRIALTAGITVETVKWNLKNIFLKSEVSSRYDAMIWARRHGLID